jgi:predicted RNA methylase
VQTRRADRKFLENALKAGKIVYSLHKNVHDERAFIKNLKANPNGFVGVAPSPFLKEFIEEHGGKIEAVYAIVMTVPHMFDFHTKAKHEFVVDLYIVKTK